MSEKIWLKSYPADMPSDIGASAFASLAEHIAILEALATRDSARAAGAMADHLAATRARTETALAARG